MKAKLAVIAALLFLSAVPAQAQSALCQDSPDIHTTIEKAISLCTSSLASVRIPGMGFMGAGPSPEERADNYYNRGLLYELNGQNDLAVADFTTALTWLGSNPNVYAARGDAYEALGERDKAAADYDFVQAHPRDDAFLYNARCWDRALRGRPLDLALADCNQAIALEKDEPDIWDSRCFLYYRMGNYQAAIPDCDEAVKLQPRMAPSLYIRGLAKLRAGDTAGGNADIVLAKDADYRIDQIYAVYGVKP